MEPTVPNDLITIKLSDLASQNNYESESDTSTAGTPVPDKSVISSFNFNNQQKIEEESSPSSFNFNVPSGLQKNQEKHGRPIKRSRIQLEESANVATSSSTSSLQHPQLTQLPQHQAQEPPPLQNSQPSLKRSKTSSSSSSSPPSSLSLRSSTRQPTTTSDNKETNDSANINGGYDGKNTTEEDVIMEGVYSTRNSVWKGTWKFKNDTSGKVSKFRYSPTTDSTLQEYKDTPCQICGGMDEYNFLFCDLCDRGYHCGCLGLIEVPKTSKWYCSTCHEPATNFNNLPPTRLWKGTFVINEQRRQETVFLQFDWRRADDETEATVAADVSGEGSNDFGKFDISGELLVFDNNDAAELEGWRQYGSVKSSDDRMYKLTCTKVYREDAEEEQNSGIKHNSGVEISAVTAAQGAVHADNGASTSKINNSSNATSSNCVQSNSAFGEFAKYVAAESKNVSGLAGDADVNGVVGSLNPVNGSDANGNDQADSVVQAVPPPQLSSSSLPQPVLSRQHSLSSKPIGDTSVLMSVKPPPSKLSRQKTEDSIQLSAMVAKYSKQSAKLDRLTITHNKLKKQYKQYESVLIRERAQYETELSELRDQLKSEKVLRKNMELQVSTLKEKIRNGKNSGNIKSTNVGSSPSSSVNVSIPNVQSISTIIGKRQPRRAVALYTDFDCFFHQTPSTHPETSQRVIKLWERLYQSFDDSIDWCTNSPRVSVNLLFNVHSPQYISKFLSACKYLPNNNVPRNFMLCCQGASHSHKKGAGRPPKAHSSDSSRSNTPVVPNQNDHDTFFSGNAGGGSVAAGLKAPGSVVSAVDAVLSGVQSNAFCLIRPPGHHCGYDGVPRKGLGEASDVGQGFCLINNVAVGMSHALTNYNIKVAIIDIDLHHGNGTQEIVERMYMNNIAGLGTDRNQQRLFFSSLHSESIFPWTSPTRALPHDVPTNMIQNVHIPLQSNSMQWQKHCENIIKKMISFKPDLVFVSAGFDAHMNDTFGGGHINLNDQDYYWIANELTTHFPRVVSVLEGGYNIDVLSMCCTSHIQGLGV